MYTYEYRAGCALPPSSALGEPPTPGTRHGLAEPAGGMLCGAPCRLPFLRRVHFGLKVPDTAETPKKRDSEFMPPWNPDDNDDLAGWCAQPVDVVQRLAAVAHCLFDTACVYACAGPRPLRMDPPSMQVPTHHGQRREK